MKEAISAFVRVYGLEHTLACVGEGLMDAVDQVETPWTQKGKLIVIDAAGCVFAKRNEAAEALR